jgi:hypothetical protein
LHAAHHVTFVCVRVLSHWVYAAIDEGPDLPALKCSSHWSLGLYLHVHVPGQHIYASASDDMALHNACNLPSFPTPLPTAPNCRTSNLLAASGHHASRLKSSIDAAEVLSNISNISSSSSSSQLRAMAPIPEFEITVSSWTNANYGAQTHSSLHARFEAWPSQPLHWVTRLTGTIHAQLTRWWRRDQVLCHDATTLKREGAMPWC